MDINDYPVINLNSDDRWARAYDNAAAWDKMWPEQDAFDFLAACEYNGLGPLTEGVKVKDLTMVKQGERDESEWIWHVTLEDDTVWQARGGCDYTGWDCQSNLTWTEIG